jgi:hypothetical protein
MFFKRIKNVMVVEIDLRSMEDPVYLPCIGHGDIV